MACLPHIHDDQGMMSATTPTKTGDSPGGNRDKKPFRLLDLPPELRTRIYSYAFTTRKFRDFSVFYFPSLTLASRQLRQESLPVLFADTNFRFAVGSDFAKAFCRRYGTNIARSISWAGTLSWTSRVRDFIHSAGDAVRFRDMTVELHDEGFLPSMDMWQISRRGCPTDSFVLPSIALLHLRVGTTGFRVTVEEGPDHPKKRVTASIPRVHLEEDVATVLGRAETVARDIAGKEGFKGFSVADLKRVAAAMRLA
ncbi:hypothetical protein PRZ48_004614 [Zasmidium cellare]|uniref:F-box domain-containing protein n=1 Tax=Zasmidium cellare TaxID=395010 RepID=A0ABR0EQQ1_ZASCE|nr:hypothetical protein PRZ48_004614 [Zasmidium cellare]